MEKPRHWRGFFMQTFMQGYSGFEGLLGEIRHLGRGCGRRGFFVQQHSNSCETRCISSAVPLFVTEDINIHGPSQPNSVTTSSARCCASPGGNKSDLLNTSQRGFCIRPGSNFCISVSNCLTWSTGFTSRPAAPGPPGAATGGCVASASETGCPTRYPPPHPRSGQGCQQ